MPIAGIRACGARCRTKAGEPCMQPAMRDSNRCRMHFGHSRKLIKHGRLTLQAQKERKEQREFLKEMRVLNEEIEKAANRA